MALLEPVLAARTTEDWITRLEAANVPCGPINRIDQVFADPQAIARGFKISMDHKQAGPIDLRREPVASCPAHRPNIVRRRPFWASTRTKF